MIASPTVYLFFIQIGVRFSPIMSWLQNYVATHRVSTNMTNHYVLS